MVRRHAPVLAALLLLIGPIALSAKGPTVRLAVTAPHLPAPVNITDPGVLDHATVWEGRFIGTAAREPDDSLPRYLVSFYVDLPRNAGVRLMYVVRYVRDPRTGAAFIHLPGRGDEWYRSNVRTILREGQDGRWFRASDAFASGLEPFLPHHDNPR
jgi:hypothetical protein